jgi:FkbM family methyltransferase
LVRKSLALDCALLGLSALPATAKARILVGKYGALAALATGRGATVTVGAAKIKLRDTSGLGTLQSCVTDFHDEVVGTDLISTNAPTIVDIGANIGQFCSAAKLFYPAATVLSFEPDPDSYAQLVANTDRLNLVRTFNVGLGSTRGMMTFYRHQLSVMSSFTTAPGEHYSSEIKLPVERLDDVLTDVDRIDLLKIDVEGFEYQVLAGAESVLQRTGAVIVEVRLGDQGKWSNLEVIDILRRASPSSHLVSTGRVLAGTGGPICFDVIIKLK